jgi:probable phosphoglycerate mutase
VYASDLRRAAETAEAVARPHGLEVRRDDRLREVRTDWDEGRSGTLKEPGVYPFLEPEPEVVERMSSVIADVVSTLAPSAPRAAVVTHNAAIALYVASVLGLTWGQLRIMPQYTSVTVLAVKDGQVVVHSVADATHLAAQRPGSD